jgi:uncharacterized membrane protein SpoIIM required for sporulation
LGARGAENAKLANQRSPDYDDKTDEAPRLAVARPLSSLTLEPNEARQGMTHHNVRYVLGISLGLIVLAFIVVYIMFFQGTAPPTIPPPSP